MRNLIRVRFDNQFHGRLLYSSTFINKEDVSGKRVLDVGCGHGWCELTLLRSGAKGVVASELSLSDLKPALRDVCHPKLSYVVANGLGLPFASRSFDTLVCWEVVEHLPAGREGRMFAELARVLKPGGGLYLSTPFASAVAKVFDPAWYFGHRHYGLRQLEELARPSGLRRVRAEVKGRWWEIVWLLDMYFSKWVLRKSPLGEGWLNRRVDTEYALPGFNTVFVAYRKDK